MTGPAEPMTRRYAWLVFALSFGLLLSDYMSRQVLNAVFPLLKAEWLLSDAQLGSLSGIVALMVGLLTFPLSLLADRWGRVRSLVLAAVVWSLATLGCAVSASYGQMFLGRFMVGVGEAAYGSVGIAVVLSVFPAALRATLSGAFIAGGAFGSVLGVSIGGVVAQHLGWRWTFAVMGVFGLVLAAVYGVVVTERKLAAADVGPGGAPDTGGRCGRSCRGCSPPSPCCVPTSAADCRCSSRWRCWPGCPASSIAPTAWRRARPGSPPASSR